LHPTFRLPSSRRLGGLLWAKNCKFENAFSKQQAATFKPYLIRRCLPPMFNFVWQPIQLFLINSGYWANAPAMPNLHKALPAYIPSTHAYIYPLLT
jgi:hypothetical protein